MTNPMLLFFGGIITAVFASTGLWTLIQRTTERYMDHKSSTTRLIMGLAHMDIVRMGLKFIERGWITDIEYKNYMSYLVEPYNELGGNGLATRVVKQVETLDIRNSPNLDWTDEIKIYEK